VKVDWALDGPIPWQDPAAAVAGTVHLSPSADELALTAAQLAAGWVPARPFALLGQMAVADPTRAPAGAESAWAYVHLPQRPRGDAADGVPRPDLTAEAYTVRLVERIEAAVEEAAPGFGSRVVARHVLSPSSMEARDPNLVGGAVNGGTAQLHQQLVFRPLPGWGRPETGLAGLFLASASAHPGGGVHGACGANAARAAVQHDRARRLVAAVTRRPAPGAR
jgi:phytoene dehydrogenase-like protein